MRLVWLYPHYYCSFLLLPFKLILNQLAQKINFYFLHLFPITLHCFINSHLFSCKRCESPVYLNLITGIVIVRCLLYHFQANKQTLKGKITRTLNKMGCKKCDICPKNSDRVRINSQKSCRFQMHCTHVNSIKRNAIKSTSAYI